MSRRTVVGEKLLKYYEEAYKIGGAKARLRLAMLSLLPSLKAGNAPDSEANIRRFEHAMNQLKKELNSK